MKTSYLVLILLAISACATDALAPTAETEQALCRPDLDECPGWPMTTAKKRAVDFTLAANPAVIPQISCAHQVSAVICSGHSVTGAGSWVDTQCQFYDLGGMRCDGWACHDGEGGEVCECNATVCWCSPPLPVCQHVVTAE